MFKYANRKSHLSYYNLEKKIIWSLLSLCGLLLFNPIKCIGQTSVNHKFDLSLYLDFESVSNPILSHEGDKIIYQRNWIDKINDERKSDIWSINLDGNKNNKIISNAHIVGWSPDGSKLAFTRKGEKGQEGMQIFVKDMTDESSVTQITNVSRTPSHIEWSPDGKNLAFTMFVPTQTNKYRLDIPFKPSNAKWTDPPRVVVQYKWRTDRHGLNERGHYHVFKVNATGGTSIQLTQGNWDDSPPSNYLNPAGGISWSKDGKEIFFSSSRKENPDSSYSRSFRNSQIYGVNVHSGSVRKLTNRVGPDYGPVVSPNNKKIAYLGFDKTRDNHYVPKLNIMNLDGSGSKIIAPDIDRRLSIVGWAKDNSGVYANVASEGTYNLYFAPINGGMKQITKGNHVLNVSDVNNGSAVGVETNYQKPPNVVKFNLNNPVLSQITDVNNDIFENIKFGNVEEIKFKSTGGLEIQGWIVKPPNFDPSKKYPLILNIHGGPEGMFNVGFNFRYQYWASQGYVLLYMNPRGSSGYGKKFGTEIKNDYPNKDFDDLMNGVDEVINRGYIDTDNMFVYGGSGGGVLTAWTVGHTDRFAAASSNYPVTDWISFVGTTDLAWWHTRFAKPFWEDPSEHLRRSPIMFVGNVSTPTMLFTGVLDERTPSSQAEEYYNALQRRNIPTKLIRFNKEYHGTSSQPSNYIRSLLYLNNWFNKWKN